MGESARKTAAEIGAARLLRNMSTSANTKVTAIGCDACAAPVLEGLIDCGAS